MLALDLRALYYCPGVLIVQNTRSIQESIRDSEGKGKRRLSTLARNEIHLTKQVTICSLTNA